MMVMMDVIMAVVVIKTMAVSAIGAAFRIEHSLHRTHAAAEAFDHRLDDMVAANENRAFADRGRQMAIAEVPDDAGEGDGVWTQ